MMNVDISDNIDEGDSTHATTAKDDIHYIEVSNELSQYGGTSLQKKFSVIGSCVISSKASLAVIQFYIWFEC